MHLGSNSASRFGARNSQPLAYSTANAASLGSLPGSNVLALPRDAGTASKRGGGMTFEPTDTATVSAEAGVMAAERKRPLVSQLRFQLGGALVVGLLLPLLLRFPITGLRFEFISSSMVMPSLIASAIAITTGYWINRQVTGYPGASDLAYVVPSLVLTFGAVLLASFFLRLDYSRYIILTSFLSAVTWLLATGYVRSRRAMPLLALVPGGNHRGITMSTAAKWLELRSQNADLAQVEGVVADLRGNLPESWERFVAKCILAGMPVYDVKNVMEALTGRVDIEHLSENSFGSVLPSNLYLKMKRTVDLALALLLLPLFAAVIILAGIAIKLDSPGPIFFAQQRMGFRAKIFTIYKLRTMRHEEDEGLRFTKAGDARITRIGQFLRKYRVDELPQILNVLKGEMSWLGPRPEAVELADWYSTEIPFYIYRHAVRPGISGWAQINQGNVAEVGAATLKLQYDFYYIKNFSPLLDLLIVIRTLGTIATGFGSR